MLRRVTLLTLMAISFSFTAHAGLGADLKQLGRDIGHGTKKVAKDVKKESKEVGKDVGDGAKKVGKDVKKAVK